MEIDLSQVNPEIMIKKIKESADRADSEEDFKMDAVQVLRKEVLDKFGLPYGKFEKGIHISGLRGRADVLYGHLFIEFEKPGVLKVKGGYDHAIDQLKRYIRGDAKVEKNFAHYFGVAIDGYKIGFIRYVDKQRAWSIQGPYDINPQNILKLLEALRGLYRKPLDAEYLIKDFGPESTTAKNTVKFFYEKLKITKSERTKTLFADWKRVFSQVCAYSAEKIKPINKFYGLPENVNPEILLFAIHTYYALIMKILAAEVAVLFGEPYMQSYIRKLEDAYLKGHRELKEEFENLEEGGIFSRIGIVNFLEADYFSWYINDWDKDIAKAIIGVVKELSFYEVGTAELEPERIKDLFKRLYQNLVHREIRRNLGEYYTPDWLGELLLNEINYSGNLKTRLLDPACGSGTFLVLAIRRAREYREEHFEDIGETLDKITKNIVGFDLNPLAVLASRTNYLIAIGDYIRQRKTERIRIPVFLADSILVERRTTLYEEVYVLKTIAGEFNIPISIVKGELLTTVLSTVEDCVKNKYETKDFQERIKREAKELGERETYILSNLFDQLSKLEEKGKNRIWIRILKNSFAPLFEGKFDYVVGNPPWINWENLPESYRISTRSLWDQYGLTKKTIGVGLGKVKKDVAMLFLARCFDRYTKDNGKLAFLIPFTTCKTQAGAGFRRFLAYECNVTKIHDLVELYPFEGATNRTSMLITEKGKTKFPIPCIMWSNPKRKGIAQESELNSVKKLTKQHNMIMTPVKEHSPETPWMIISEKSRKAIKSILGESPYYKAHEGINTALNAVYWIDVLSKHHKGLLISNTKVRGLKKKVKDIEIVLKSDLIFPLIRGRDIKRWLVKPYSNYIILPVNEKGETLSHHELKTKYPKEYEYFYSYFNKLVNRGGEPYKTRLKAYREKKFSEAERVSPPFYWLFNVRPSLARYKVVWKRIAGGITGKAVGFASAVFEPTKDKLLEEVKPEVINDSLIVIPFEEEKEAYYVCGALNSTPVLFTIASYTYELRMETHITHYVRIPKFNPKNELHVKISELSKEAHKLSKKDKNKELRDIEKKIDGKVAQLYGISNYELSQIIKSLNILKGRDE